MEKGQNNSILSPASKSYLRKKLFTAKKASKKTRDNMEKKIFLPISNSLLMQAESTDML